MMDDSMNYCDVCGAMYSAADSGLYAVGADSEDETTVLNETVIKNDDNTAGNVQYPVSRYGYQQNYDYQYQLQNQQFQNQQLQNQQFINQQIIEQQKMLNNVVQQQQYMNNKIESSKPYVYLPTPVNGAGIIKNVFAIVAAIVCFASIFLPFGGDTSIATTSDYLSSLYREYGLDFIDFFGDDADFGVNFLMLTILISPWVTGALAIVLLINAFIDRLAVIKLILEIAEIIIYLGWIFTCIEDEFFSVEDFQIGFWMGIAGVIMSIISNYTAVKRDAALYAPRRIGGYGISDANSRSVAAMVDDDFSNITWICPYCGMKNRENRCLNCGTVRY